MNRLSSLVMIIGCTLGIGVIVMALMPNEEVLPEFGAASDIPLPSLEPPGPTVGPPENYAAIAERPLFRKGRTPPTDSVATPLATTQVAIPTTSAQIDGLRLAAVFRGGDEPRALIETASGESIAVAQGDEVQNWRVVEIRDTELVLGLRGQQQTLQVHDFSAIGAPRINPRSRALTDRQRTAQRRRSENSRNDLPTPRQRRDRRDEDREDD
jgi:hypothetical protein